MLRPVAAREPAKEIGTSLPWKWQLWFAIALLGLFVGLAVWMVMIADDTDAAWDRRVYVFGSVEALVFAAVGWVFGREVHRADAEKARQDADQAKKDAKAAQAEAADKREEAATERMKGQSLAAAVDAAAGAPTPDGGQARDVGLSGQGVAPPVPASQLSSLQTLAQRLYGSG